MIGNLLLSKFKRHLVQRRSEGRRKTVYVALAYLRRHCVHCLGQVFQFKQLRKSSFWVVQLEFKGGSHPIRSERTSCRSGKSSFDTVLTLLVQSSARKASENRVVSVVDC